jgi:hypothetical protein
MSDKRWEPPPGQEVREPQPVHGDTDQPRNFETVGRETDADRDDRYLEDEINFSGSER